MANKIPRVAVREQDAAVRATNFEEVCYGYNDEEARLEASRCLACKRPRCVEACPVNINIPAFIAELTKGDVAAAAEVIAADSSLPSICGRVCPQETQCEGIVRAGGSRASPWPSASWSVTSATGTSRMATWRTAAAPCRTAAVWLSWAAAPRPCLRERSGEDGV